ncbi:MAG: hypothetical protein K0U20_04000 [Proteobacteria bacterium]|nr:hypothetical protein [Pseudomonadota bacterium]MCH9749770.1 hypothetical protein [Pseudomonadota bacterium]
MNIKNPDTLIVLDTINIHPKKNNDIILWSAYEPLDDNNFFSLPQIVENNAEYFKHEYLSFIHDLGGVVVGKKKALEYLKMQDGFSFWWTTLLVEKSNIAKSLQINNAIKFLAFKYWFDKNSYNKILLYTHNSKLVESMSMFCKDIDIEFDIAKDLKTDKTTQIHKKLYNYFPDFIQSMLWLLWKVISIWPLKGVGVDKWKSSTSKITFLSSLVNLDKNSANKKVFKSNYWPILPSLLKKHNLHSNWIHMYSETSDLPNATIAKNVINKFNNLKNGIETHTTIYSFVNAFIVYKVILNLIRLSYIKLKIRKSIIMKSGILWPFIESDFNNSLSGIDAARNLLYMGLFENAFSSLTRQDKGFYLQENQGWECTFIQSWRKFRHNNHLIAVPHTPIKFWDMRRFVDKRSYMSSHKSLLPLPDYIGVNSDLSKNMHLESGCMNDRLVKLEALRYMHLNNFSNCAQSGLNLTKSIVLVLGDYSKENTLLQMKLLLNSSKYVSTPIQYLIKPHPATPIFSKDYPGMDLVITNKPINEIVNCCQLAYASSTTSASVDAYCLGLPVVIVANPKTLNTSPLRGCKDAVFVDSSRRLAKVLNNVDKMKINPKQGKNFLYTNSDIHRWKKIFGIVEHYSIDYN